MEWGRDSQGKLFVLMADKSGVDLNYKKVKEMMKGREVRPRSQ